MLEAIEINRPKESNNLVQDQVLELKKEIDLIKSKMTREGSSPVTSDRNNNSTMQAQVLDQILKNVQEIKSNGNNTIINSPHPIRNAQNELYPSHVHRKGKQNMFYSDVANVMSHEYLRKKNGRASNQINILKANLSASDTAFSPSRVHLLQNEVTEDDRRSIVQQHV